LTCIYTKPTFIAQYTRWNSFGPSNTKPTISAT